MWRVFNMVDRHTKQPRQLTYYDDGVGTDDLRWLRLFGGAFGWGLSRNIRKAYAFLAMNYEPGDQIYLFGFSRGAFTVRSLAGVILSCGLLTRRALLNAQGHRDAMIKKIVRAYRTPSPAHEKWREWRLRRAAQLGGFGRDALRPNVPIHFIGAWDTVDAVGVPFDEIKHLEVLSVRILKLRLWRFSNCELHQYVQQERHALALDDERRTFHPVLWRETKNDAARLRQVWFAGAHSNVGGGYPKDGLAYVSLDWMMGEAEAAGLKFWDDARRECKRKADPHAKLYNSRTGLQALYRYAPRDTYQVAQAAGPSIHESVGQRIQRGTDYYVPKVLDARPYRVAQTT